MGWRVAPVLGVGAWRDGAAADTQPAVIGGLEGEWRGYRHHAVLADFRYGAYRRHVLTAPPDGVAVRESDLGLRLAYAYEFLHHWTSSGRATGELLVGGFWRTIQDQAAARLRVGYRSEILILEHGDRSFDGLALVLDLGL